MSGLHRTRPERVQKALTLAKAADEKDDGAAAVSHLKDAVKLLLLEKDALYKLVIRATLDDVNEERASVLDTLGCWHLHEKDYILACNSFEQAASLYRTLGMKEHLKTCLISWKMALRYRSRATSDQEEVAVLRDLLFRKAAEVNLELRTLELENSAEHHAVHPVCIQTARNMQYLLCV